MQTHMSQKSYWDSGKMNSENKSCGVVYAVSGASRNRLECIFSAQSIKRNHKDIGVTVFSDETNEQLLKKEDCFDDIRKVKNPNRRNKLDAILNSPYSRTLYLDNDTELKKPILKEAFRLLDNFDIALSHAPLKRVCTQIDSIPNSFPEFNGGVIFFKNSLCVRKVMKRWHDDYHEKNINTRYGHRDQPYLRRALWESSLRIATLIPEYNSRTSKVNSRVCIRHRHNLHRKK